MIPLKPFRQTPGYCGPACLVMIFDYYGIKMTEKEIAKKAGSIRSIGTNTKGLVKVAKELGFKTILKDNADIKDLKSFIKKEIPVIVDWFSPEGEPDGHYSVVVNIDKQNIYLQDPELGHLRSLNLQVFKRLWFDFPGNFIKSSNDLVLRRMLAVHP